MTDIEPFIPVQLAKVFDLQTHVDSIFGSAPNITLDTFRSQLEAELKSRLPGGLISAFTAISQGVGDLSFSLNFDANAAISTALELQSGLLPDLDIGFDMDVLRNFDLISRWNYPISVLTSSMVRYPSPHRRRCLP